MARLIRFGRSNALWRRVQRHEQMSTLFGPRPLATTAVSPPPLAPPLPVTEASAEPIVQPAPIASSPAPKTAAPTVVSPPTIQPPPVASSPASKTAAPTTAVSTPAPADDDPNWRRLQKIYQLHQQPPADQAIPIQRQTEPTAVLSEDAPQRKESPQVQSVPLEAAWPVQRRTQPDTTSPTPPKRTEKGEPSFSADEAKQVGDVLQQVEPAKQTDSSVELIMPTRPRPQRPAPPASSVAPTTPSDPMPAPKTETAVSPPPLVETDIGPLPSDLWELMGKTPPASAPSAERPAPIQKKEEPASQESEKVPANVEEINHTPEKSEQLPSIEPVEHRDAFNETPESEASGTKTEEIAQAKHVDPVSPPSIQRQSENKLTAQSAPPPEQTASEPSITASTLSVKEAEPAVLPPPAEKTLPLKRPFPPQTPAKREAAFTSTPGQSLAIQTEDEPAHSMLYRQAEPPTAHLSLPSDSPSRATAVMAQAETAVSRSLPEITPPAIGDEKYEKMRRQQPVTAVATPTALAKKPDPPMAVATPTPLARNPHPPTAVHSTAVTPNYGAIQRFAQLDNWEETMEETAVFNQAPPPEANEATAAINNRLPHSSEETPQQEEEGGFDIDALSQQVYQALKRKLAAERERGQL